MPAEVAPWDALSAHISSRFLNYTLFFFKCCCCLSLRRKSETILLDFPISCWNKKKKTRFKEKKIQVVRWACGAIVKIEQVHPCHSAGFKSWLCLGMQCSNANLAREQEMALEHRLLSPCGRPGLGSGSWFLG